MALVIVIPINKVDWHFNLEFSSDFTQGIPSPGWLSFRFSVLGVARYVMFFRGAPSLYDTWYLVGYQVLYQEMYQVGPTSYLLPVGTYSIW